MAASLVMRQALACTPIHFFSAVLNGCPELESRTDVPHDRSWVNPQMVDITS